MLNLQEKLASLRLVSVSCFPSWLKIPGTWCVLLALSANKVLVSFQNGTYHCTVYGTGSLQCVIPQVSRTTLEQFRYRYLFSVGIIRPFFKSGIRPGWRPDKQAGYAAKSVSGAYRYCT